MSDRNKNFDKDVPDEVFEKIAAEKRRKLEEFLKGLEQQEPPRRSADATMTIHSDLFPPSSNRRNAEPTDFTRKVELPDEPENEWTDRQEEEWSGDDDVKIFGDPEPVSEPVVRESKKASVDDDEPDTLSLFEQDHIIEEEVSEAKRLAEEKRLHREAAAEQQETEEEAEQARPSTQEILKQARYEKIRSFSLDQNLDLEAQDEDGEPEAEEDEEDVYEYLPDSDVLKIRDDFGAWKSRRLLQVWVSLACFVLMLFVVLAPALPFRLLPYTLQQGSVSSQITSNEALPTNSSAANINDVGAVSDVTRAAVVPSQPVDEITSIPADDVSADSEFDVNANRSQVRVLLIVLLGLAAILVIFSFDTLRDGAVDLVCMSASYQSGAFVVFLVCLVQAVFLVIDPAQTSFVSGAMGVFMPTAALAVLLAEVSTYLRLVRDENNFSVIASGPAGHLRVQNIGDSNALERPRGDADCATAVFVPAEFSSDFFAMADCEDGCDRTQRVLVPVVVVLSLLLGFAAFLLNGREPAYFITVLAGMVCAVLPLSMGVFTVIGQLRASRVGAEIGFAVSNQFAYEDATEMTSVVVSDTEIFSAKSMVLHGIKTFNEKRMDEAIVVAASASQKRGGPLRELFTGILSENEAYLLEVDNETVYQPEKGMVCWIGGKRVVMGTREFVGGYDIELPDAEYETKYAKNGRSLVYLALGNEMMAIFVVSYRVIPEIGAMLRAVNACGVTILVNTNDPCLTSIQLCRALKLPAGSVLALNTQGKDTFERLTQPTASLKSGVVCAGGTASQLAAVADCFRMRRSYSAGMGLQYALMAIAAVIVVAEVLFGKLDVLTMGTVALIQLIGAGLLCGLQMLFRYRIGRRRKQ